MFVRNNLNIYLQLYYKIMILIPKISLKILEISIESLYGCLNLK